LLHHFCEAQLAAKDQKKRSSFILLNMRTVVALLLVPLLAALSASGQQMGASFFPAKVLCS
jgi:hypothetical protein